MLRPTAIQVEATCEYKILVTFDNGEKMLMCYVDEENNFTYLLYDLATSKAKKIGMPKMNREVYNG